MTRAEVIDVIVKSLEKADNEELADAYMYIVDCSEDPCCPLYDECRGRHIVLRCDRLVMKKLEEEEQHG